MKTFKPLKLGLLTRPFEFRRRFFLGVTVFGYIPLNSELHLLSEVSMWRMVTDQLGPETPLDAGMPKRHGEFLVCAEACAPGGQPQPSVAVRATLAGIEKVLVVHGEREWVGRQPGPPKPFTRMRLDWASAYGGEGYAENPLGMGLAPSVVDGRSVHLLPHVEYPDHPLSAPNKPGRPAGFGPLDLGWPQRQVHAGTHDDRWLKEDFPGFARDIDWHFFNVASADQQFPTPLRGDERYLLQNLHPQRSWIEGRLPGLQPRCFVTRSGREPTAFDEVPMALTTVWFFPHIERAVLVHHGSVEIAEEDARDVTHILIAGERAGESRAPGHYQDVIRRRLDKRDGPIHSLCDGDLLPAGMPSEDEELQASLRMHEGEGLMQKRAAQRIDAERQKARSQAQAAGMDPDHDGMASTPDDPPPRKLEDLPAYLNRQQVQADKRKAETDARRATSAREIQAQYAAEGLSTESVTPVAPVGPPRFTAERQIQDSKSQLAALQASGGATPPMEQMLGGEKMHAGWRTLEHKLKDGYRQSAHMQSAAPPVDAAVAHQWREGALKVREAGRSYAGMNLTGADFSGMNLEGASFEGAFLESVNFEGAQLNGCDFSRAVLAHASLRGAQLRGAKLAQANLGAAVLAQAVLDEADLTGAILHKADLSGASLNRALLSDADLSGARLAGARMDGIQGAGLLFNEVDLRGMSLAGSMLNGAVFLKAQLSEVDLSRALLVSANFLDVDAQGAIFDEADLTNARFVERCRLQGARFRRAKMPSALLRACMLDGADFTAAVLDGGDLSDAQVRKANLHRVSAVGALVIQADLSGSLMTLANFREALLTRSVLENCDMRGCNLYCADLARVRVSASTRLDDALTTKARIHPRATVSPGT